MSCLETTIFKSGCLSYRVLLLVDLYAASNCPNTFSFFHISSVLLYPPLLSLFVSYKLFLFGKSLIRIGCFAFFFPFRF